MTAEAQATQQAIAAEVERQELMSATVAAMLPALYETAAAIDTYLAAVVKAEEEAEAKRQAEAAKKSSAGGSGVCTRYVSTWYGGSRLILVPCR